MQQIKSTTREPVRVCILTSSWKKAHLANVSNTLYGALHAANLIVRCEDKGRHRVAITTSVRPLLAVKAFRHLNYVWNNCITCKYTYVKNLQICTLYQAKCSIPLQNITYLKHGFREVECHWSSVERPGYRRTCVNRTKHTHKGKSTTA